MLQRWFQVRIAARSRQLARLAVASDAVWELHGFE